MKKFCINLLILLIHFAVGDEEFCYSPSIETTELVHPLLKEIKNSIFQRMKHFDDENIAGYIEVRLI